MYSNQLMLCLGDRYKQYIAERQAIYCFALRIFRQLSAFDFSPNKNNDLAKARNGQRFALGFALGVQLSAK